MYPGVQNLCELYFGSTFDSLVQRCLRKLYVTINWSSDHSHTPTFVFGTHSVPLTYDLCLLNSYQIKILNNRNIILQVFYLYMGKKIYVHVGLLLPGSCAQQFHHATII